MITFKTFKRQLFFFLLLQVLVADTSATKHQKWTTMVMVLMADGDKSVMACVSLFTKICDNAR